MDIRVAAYAVIVDDERRLLLSHWNEQGRSGWSMPGGGIDLGEDPADAAVREVFEETGYHVRLGRLLGVHSHVVPPEHRLSAATEPLHAIRIIYRASIIGGVLTHEIGGSSDEARWVALDEVRTLQRVSLVDIALEFAGL